MNSPVSITNKIKGLLLVLSALLIASFFASWVSWDTINVSGADMPLGNFFSISENNFMLANPFPKFNFVLFIFWLIPAFALLGIILILLNKKSIVIFLIAGILAISAATVYILFSNKLEDLGVKHELNIGIYLTVLASAGIILICSQGWLRKIVLLLIGPLIVWSSFMLISSYLENQKFGNEKADYTINANELIKEFITSDSAANAKYRERIISVTGSISTIETPNDSTVNIKFIDTLTGSYAIFPFVNESLEDVKKLKEGDSVSIKGSCSGGVYSQILGTEFITFKRCVLNKK